jgi:hypothetical protein
MPFGKKVDPRGQEINFDLVYLNLIAPAIQSAGIEPVRWDDLSAAGPVSRSIFERLIQSDFVVADISANIPNVYYELGVRHAMRRQATVLIAREGTMIPADLAGLLVLKYRLNEVGRPENLEEFAKILGTILSGSVPAAGESPVYQVLDIEPPKLPTNTVLASREISDRVTGLDWKTRISKARFEGDDELRRLESEMTDVSPEVLVELLKAYRRGGAWEDVVRVWNKLPASVAASPTIQEQHAMALNRIGQSDRAEAVLHELLRVSGPSSETYGILGRVYKDRWQLATKAGDSKMAAQSLNLAIESYVSGFETDWRDFYPGINAITLMEIRGDQDPRRDEMIPVVRYAVKRKLVKSKPEYWDFATLLELEVLANAPESANNAVERIQRTDTDAWQLETTARNVGMIRQAREQRGADVQWIAAIEQRLTKPSSRIES